MIRDFGVMKPQKEREQLRAVAENYLDSQQWHACAGSMVQMPKVNSKVIYFPQGHAEHAQGVDFSHCRQIPALIPCRVSAIRYMADPETDEVFAKMKLIPLSGNEAFVDDSGADDDGMLGGVELQEKPASFAKTLTQSDANNGGGFSVPRYCAETIFPKLDYTADPPVQTIIAKDVHGEPWRFRHIYRGTPRRHLLTTGWSNFVNKKKLVAGDSIVFLRVGNGDLCVGIRRAKRGLGSGNECPSGWNAFGGYGYMKEEENKLMRRNANTDAKSKVRAESVIKAATLAASGQPFEVIYYPRASTPEFCVKASAVRNAMQIQWCPGMRFKMAFETEDSSRISWFMGTISSVQVADPINWPNSSWRLLQVAWDEPDLLQNVKRVSPWLVELVSNMPTIHLSAFSPPRKKLRIPQAPDFSLLGQLPMPPSFSSNLLRSNSPLCCVSDNTPAGIQGARHAQLGQFSFDHHFNKLPTGLFPPGFHQLDHAAMPSGIQGNNFLADTKKSENVSCLLTVGNSLPGLKENNRTKTPHIFLFGKLIFPEQQKSQTRSGNAHENSSSEGQPEKVENFSDGSGSAVLQNGPLENSSDEGSPCYKDHHKADLCLETGHRKVFVQSEEVGRTVDLSVLSSYEELYGKLANMFGTKSSEIMNNVLYRDASGVTKHAGDGPFSEFLKTARRLTVLTDSSSSN